MRSTEHTPLTYDVGTAAEIADVSTYVIYRLVKEQKIKAVKVGRAIRIPRLHFEKYLSGELEGGVLIEPNAK
jgi:excisionase family DNA binding protein